MRILNALEHLLKQQRDGNRFAKFTLTQQTFNPHICIYVISLNEHSKVNFVETQLMKQRQPEGNKNLKSKKGKTIEIGEMFPVFYIPFREVIKDS